MPKNKSEYTSSQISKVIAESLVEIKGEEIQILDLKKIPNAVCDYFVICHGNSTTQVDSLAGNVLMKVKKDLGLLPVNKEGFENSEWILIDYFDVVVHVFQGHTRSFYQLESLWADAKVKNINVPNQD